MKGEIVDVKEFRTQIERVYEAHPTACGSSFGELLCWELHTQPVNPRMMHKTITDGYCVGLTLKELAQKWGITVTFLGELIADHCKRLEEW